MAVTTYAGFDVLEAEPSFDDPTTNYTRSLFHNDSLTGKVGVLDRSGVAVVQPRKFHWVMDGRGEIQDYRAFVAARRGASVPVWVPSWRFDFPLAADVPAASAGLSILAIGFVKYMFVNPARRHLAVIMPDRTKYYRKVIAVADLGATETLTLDAALPAPVSARGMVCTLALCRLAVDDPELVWQSRNVAEATLDFVELPLEVPA
jgi:hypothetical protein